MKTKLVRVGSNWLQNTKLFTAAAVLALGMAFTTAKAQIIVDNRDPGFSASSAWSTGWAPDQYGVDYRFHTQGAISDAATWTYYGASVIAPHSVYAWWTAGLNRAKDATYIVYHSTGTTTVKVNQQINGGKWNLLGTWPMSVGQVKLTPWSSSPVNAIVVADAIMWR